MMERTELEGSPLDWSTTLEMRSLMQMERPLSLVPIHRRPSSSTYRQFTLRTDS